MFLHNHTKYERGKWKEEEGMSGPHDQSSGPCYLPVRGISRVRTRVEKIEEKGESIGGKRERTIG